jgi:hypothetical protein
MTFTSFRDLISIRQILGGDGLFRLPKAANR